MHATGTGRTTESDGRPKICLFMRWLSSLQLPRLVDARSEVSASIGINALAARTEEEQDYGNPPSLQVSKRFLNDAS